MPLGVIAGPADEPAGGFVGRAWLLERITAWFANRDSARYLLVLGAPGTGKSYVAPIELATLQFSLDGSDLFCADDRDPPALYRFKLIDRLDRNGDPRPRKPSA